MSGRELLAVLAMILPSFLLIAITAFTLGLSADVVTAPSGVGFIHGGAPEVRAHERHEASIRDRPRIATQKLMRDPWEKSTSAMSSRAPEPVQCDSSMSDQKTLCFYY